MWVSQSQCSASPHSCLKEPAGSTMELWMHQAIKGAVCLNTFVFKRFFCKYLCIFILRAGEWGSQLGEAQVRFLYTGLTSLSLLAELYTSGCWKIQRNTQNLQSNEASYLFLVIQKVLTTNTRVFTCAILSLWKFVINVAHNTGMATLSKSVQQEEYFLGNKVKIFAFSWISMGQINEVAAPSQISTRETWESGCIDSTSIHGAAQQSRKPSLQFQNFIQLWHRKVNCCLNNASGQIMLIKCLHSNLITQCNEIALYTNTVHPARAESWGGRHQWVIAQSHGSLQN